MSSIGDLALVFSLAEHPFAIEVKELVEVTEGLKISSSGDIPEGCLGAVAYRDQRVLLLDLGKALRLSGCKRASDIILVVRLFGHTVALPADSVIGVSGTKERLLPFPDCMMEKKGLYPAVFDKDGDFVLMVDLKVLFDQAFFEKLETVGSEEG